MEHSTEILYNRTRVYCSAVHRFGSDALLLARFSEPKRAWRAADLCSGCGIVSLEWHDRGHRGPCLGLELQPEASALLAAACAEQGIEHITPVCADLRSFREGEGSYDLCACNPPYFTAGEQAANRARATARHEKDCTLDDLTAAFGPERSITLCRELTKLHEEIWKTTLGEAQTHYAENDPRGEYVLVMAGAPAAEAEEELTLEQTAQRALELTRNGYAASAAAKAAAQGTPYSKSEVYKQLLALQAD